MTFQYGNKEIEYLKSKDKHLSEVIERIGLIARPMDDDLFSSVVHHIIVSRYLLRHSLPSGTG